MKRTVLITTALVGVLAVVTVFGAATYRTALAATGNRSGQPAQGIAQGGFAPATLAQGADLSVMDRGGRGGGSDEALAKALGITTDELQAAYTKAYEAALAQSVKDGQITQAQADEMGGRGIGRMHLEGIDFDALLAEALGVSVDDLQAARLEARNAEIDQAVADGNMTQEQADLIKARQALADSQSFQDALQAAYESAVQQALKDGVITQAQADLILAEGPNGFGPMGGPDGPGGPGGHGGRGGHGDFAPGAGPQAPEQPETETTDNEL